LCRPIDANESSAFRGVMCVVALSDSERLFAKSGVASPNLLRAAQNAVTEGSDCALQHVAGRA
jgi:hypothetical protein